MPGTIIVHADNPRVLTPQQVAMLLGCSLNHTVRLIRAKRLAAVNLAPSANRQALYRIPLAAVQSFLQEAVV